MLTTLRFAGLVAALTLLPALPSYASAWYSGASVASDGIVHGWGVTDVTTSYMYHVAYVSVTLTSPNGRQAHLDVRSAHNSVREDVYLPFDPNDLGQYELVSMHHAFCNLVMDWIFYELLNQAETTVPYVVLTLRNSGTASADDSARVEYQFQLGTYNLGTFFSTGWSARVFRTGVEIVGWVYPTSYTGSIIFRRLIVKSRAYHDTVELTELRKDNETDPYDPAFQDQHPQSGGSGGKVYDLEAPGIGTADNDPVGYIIRKRANHREWAELPNGTKVSADLNWFSRLSVIRTGQTTEALRTDITGDNIAAAGSTPTTWNLQ